MLGPLAGQIWQVFGRQSSSIFCSCKAKQESDLSYHNLTCPRLCAANVCVFMCRDAAGGYDPRGGADGYRGGGRGGYGGGYRGEGGGGYR